MANSRIIITFNDGIVVDDYLSFRIYRFATPTFGQTQSETFKLADPRASNGDVVLGLSGIENATNFEESFNIDYGSLYNVSRISNVVTAEFTTDEWCFDTFVTNSAFISSAIDCVGVSTFQFIGDPVLSAATKLCSNVNITLETTELATKIYKNGILSIDGNLDNPVTFPLIRGIDNIITLENATNATLSYIESRIDYLTSENITVTVNQSLIGATIIVNVINTLGLTLESSLDNVNWFPIDKVYTGQSLGTKFLYVRDQYGCVKSKEYTITELGTREPFFRISKANSINFSKFEVWNGCTIFKNDENTLDCQGLQQNLHITDNLFQTCDTTTIQFKSNYETNSAVLRDSNNSDTALSITKKSANLGRFQSMDAIYYKYREGKLGIRFETGNYYDELGVPLAETYTLNGNLPEFAIIGEYITIVNLGTFEIVDVLTDNSNSISKRAIIVNYFYEGEDVEVIVKSTYDILDYEIYEFVIDWSLFSVGKYNVIITALDTINGTEVHNSERINLATEHNHTLAISYSNNNNRDVFYKYGIVHFIRVPFVKFISKTQDDNEINISDDNSVVVESTVYEKNEIKFDVLSGSLKSKLIVALSCENLFVNGIGYVKDGNVDEENIDNTNLYEVTSTLIKTNVSYTNFKQGQTGIDNDYGTLDIPLIITAGTNFIKS